MQTTTEFRQLQLNPLLLNNLSRQQLQQLTPVQTVGIPPALNGQDLLVSANTGSGKTLAFLVPCIHQLLSQQVKHLSTRCLILTPTRELAHQILSLTHKLIKGSRLRVALLTGGETYQYQQSLLRKNPELIIATPGRFNEHQRKRHTDIEALEIMVIDEADRMAAAGFVEDVYQIAATTNQTHQTLFYSATLDNDKTAHLAQKLLHNPCKLMLNQHHKIKPTIQQAVILCDDLAHKQRVISYLLAHSDAKIAGQQISSADTATSDQQATTRAAKQIVFVNSRHLCDHLTQFLQTHQHQAAALHGGLDQATRNQRVNAFRRGTLTVLVATEVAARGLDIPHINRVINFDTPKHPDDYLHRSGRTGRYQATGTAITLVNPSERKQLERIEHKQGQTLTRQVIKGLGARQHKDKSSQPPTKPQKPTTSRSSTSLRTSRKPAKQGQSSWGDGHQPFGRK